MRTFIYVAFSCRIKNIGQTAARIIQNIPFQVSHSESLDTRQHVQRHLFVKIGKEIFVRYILNAFRSLHHFQQIIPFYLFACFPETEIQILRHCNLDIFSYIRNHCIRRQFHTEIHPLFTAYIHPFCIFNHNSKRIPLQVKFGQSKIGCSFCKQFFQFIIRKERPVLGYKVDMRLSILTQSDIHNL